MQKINQLRQLLSEYFILTQTWIISLPRRNWVSYHAQQSIKHSQKQHTPRFTDRLFELWFTWMQPDHWRVSLVLALAVVLVPQVLMGWLFNANCLSPQFFNFIDADFLSTVWQILASIIGISFVIVVFLTQYSQDRVYERRAFPIYVSATSMIFTVMVGLLTLMSMGIAFALLRSGSNTNPWILGVGLWNSILFLFNIVVTLILYVRTYQLLSPSYFRNMLIRYHRRRVLERVHQELLKRVKQNVSIHFIESLGIEPSLYKSDIPGRIGIKLSKSITEPHVVVDVNLDLISLASRNAKKLMREFAKDKFSFFGIPGRGLSKEYPEIASIVPEFDQNQIVLPLRRSLRIIPSKSAKAKSAAEDLLINRDLVSTAIASGQADNVESSLNLYIETINAFLDALKQLGYRFTPELADSESGWFNRWDIFETVHRQYVSLLREALKSGNSEIISEFVGFPRQVMTLALQYQDHFAFREFADLYSLIYLLSTQNVPDSHATDQIAERSGRLLAEFANYQIGSQFLQKDLPEENAKELIAYAEHIVVIFSQLAKYQIDNLDFSHYRLTIGSIRRLLDGFTSKHDEYKLSELEFQNRHVTDEVLKAEIVRELHKERILNSLAMRLQKTRRAALFGLGAWLCHLVDNGKLSDDKFEKLAQPIGQEFGSLKLLNECYNNTVEMDDRDRFSWRSWEMGEWVDDAYGEGKFGSINFSSWLSTYYAYRALELTPENPNDILEIKPTATIKGALDTTKSRIKHFSENKNWESIIKRLGDLAVKTKILEKSHEVAYAQQLEIEEIEVIQAPIDSELIRRFCKEVEDTWQEEGFFRKLFTAYGRSSSQTAATPPKELVPFGIYTRTPKGVFIDNPRMGYQGWGESFGRSMAQIEDDRISLIFDQLPTVSATLDKFDEVLLQQISLLKTKGLNPIILYGHALHRRFYESTKYEPHWRTTKTAPNRLRNLDGFYDDVVVLRPHISPDSVVLYDPAEFGDFIQYKVDVDKPDYPLAFSVKEISEDRAKEYLANHPELAKHPETGSNLSEAEALRRIQQDVELAIWQRSDIENVNLKSGAVIKFAEAENKAEIT